MIVIEKRKDSRNQFLLSATVDTIASMSINTRIAMPRMASVDCCFCLNMCVRSFV